MSLPSSECSTPSGIIASVTLMISALLRDPSPPDERLHVHAGYGVTAPRWGSPHQSREPLAETALLGRSVPQPRDVALERVGRPSPRHEQPPLVERERLQLAAVAGCSTPSAIIASVTVRELRDRHHGLMPGGAYGAHERTSFAAASGRAGQGPFQAGPAAAYVLLRLREAPRHRSEIARRLHAP